MTDMQPEDEVHPGDTYARSQIESWFQIHEAMSERRVAWAREAGTGTRQREIELEGALKEQAEYEAGYAAYRAGLQPHYKLVERFARIAGSVGGLAEQFVVVDQDQAVDGPAELSDYAAASRAYRVRWATCQDAMRRWGWWVPGEPPTAEMREEWAREMEADDAWNVAHGQDPVWTGDIAELRGTGPAAPSAS
jgi:hypothetical protein